MKLSLLAPLELRWKEASLNPRRRRERERAFHISNQPVNHISSFARPLHRAFRRSLAVCGLPLKMEGLMVGVEGPCRRREVALRARRRYSLPGYPSPPQARGPPLTIMRVCLLQAGLPIWAWIYKMFCSVTH